MLAAWVRSQTGHRHSQVAESADARRLERRVHLDVGVQVSPWLLGLLAIAQARASANFELNNAGATGVHPAFIRLVCSARYRDLQLDAAKTAHPGVAGGQLLNLTRSQTGKAIRP